MPIAHTYLKHHWNNMWEAERSSDRRGNNEVIENTEKGKRCGSQTPQSILFIFDF